MEEVRKHTLTCKQCGSTYDMSPYLDKLSCEFFEKVDKAIKEMKNAT